MNRPAQVLTIAGFAMLICTSPLAQEYPDQLLWGDTHLHSNLSVDAYIFGNHTADADTAYRFAKGIPAIHPYTRAKVQLETPLDFLAVTDHAEMLGMPYSLFEQSDPRLANSRLGQRLVELRAEGKVGHAARIIVWGMNSAGLSEAERTQKVSAAIKLKWWFERLIGKKTNVEQDLKWVSSDPSLVDELNLADIARSNWDINIAAAERHNEPGKFTTLIGWEYSATRDGANLHRVVLMPDSGEIARKFLPFSSIDSINPEDLWHWLDDTSAATGAQFVSIPHNSNVSKGQMFARIDSSGDPIDGKYAALRSRFETVAEVTQIKGTSETHPLLSPDDEFADFEFFRHLLEMRADRPQTPTPTEGDYVRSALKTGLEIDKNIGINPYKLGMIGATDSHTGLASAEENNFLGKMALDSIPENKERGLGRLSGWSMSASGLSGVWAHNNSRSEIIAAIKRREVYGTTGPRIALRFFGGFEFEDSDLTVNSFAKVGYAKGVPMGSDLVGDSAQTMQAPSFLLHAVKDPKGANLDRIQVVKGWLDPTGHAQEKVYDAAWSGDRKPDATGQVPAIGDTVDRSTARFQNTIGAKELTGIWHDPDFAPDARAFYYIRVLQIPTPRNSLYDSLALNKAPPDSYPQTLQERAYSSPIWYAPAPNSTE